ncbi:glycosyltransferase [Salinimicrobium catena]|uniref:glycosyltransferase family 2 protein n=1 Tax=Salinimicrobium catena TaxID=390640 RepID=UPI002FE4B425
MEFQDFQNKYQKVTPQEYPNSVKKNPVVSVCVQTYQHESYIKNCLDGILMQKINFPLEILLGEDDSDDATREICIDYAQKYPDRIRLFLHHRENNIKIGGRPTGRFNFLHNIYSAQGKYIALCEGDDYWIDPYKLQKQVDFLEANPNYVLCFHKIKILTRGGKIVDDFITNPPANSTDLKDFTEKGNYIHTPSGVFRNSIQKFPLEFTHVPFGDYFLYFLLGRYGKFYCLDEAMAIYRHGVGIISKMTPKQILLANMKLYTAMISCSPNDNIKEVLFERKERIFDFYFEKACRIPPIKTQISIKLKNLLSNW